QARTADVSIRSMKSGEVRHLQPSDTVIGERVFSARYELAGSDRRSGYYLITVTYP
ncbi:type 1 fimbrial protein, partial [Pseudomonas aeruginosa]